MIAIHKLLFLAAGLLVGAMPGARAQPGPVPAGADAAIHRLGTAFVRASGHVGLSVGIVDHGQTRLYQFGSTQQGSPQVPTAQTVYEIGSVSKTFTSLLLAQAVVEKRVQLTDDIRQYLDGDFPNLAYAGQPIQLLHLATTTSALPDNFPDPKAFAGVPADSLVPLLARTAASYTRQQFFQDLRQVRLTVAPGQQPRHSNVAGQLLGYILERVYQRPFAELLATKLEQPLALSPGTAAPSALAATGYNDRGRPMPALLLADMPAAGGLRYSPADMLRYVAHQLDEQQPAVRLSHEVRWGTPATQAIALNWVVSKTVDGQRRLRHSGGTFGFASFCDLYPDQQTGLVLLANESDPATQDALQQLSEQIMVALHGEPPALLALQAALQQRGYARAPAAVRQARRQHPELFLGEDYVNNWGYTLLALGKLPEALEIFKLNVSLYPASWNPYDSLAETYARLGNRKAAVANYQHSLKLNPANTNARDYLAKNHAAPAP
ncbi:class A beta-lactamase-related serine hydrolase [Hymenobacter sp. 15J16-1T3B]|uniref:serine hydrolase domain-containing protein n=1 Tax=Hymenobacter sp. 15J16-1T3B TaxID=2886941 RepID=UPI001D10B951|nr:class A beta-lactamase-related serine hydrolase [Hymenobacter sp. 15J16-1T3B]MCC3160827.1 class A beta-lactamase-related serine hydrolase [Hymenobacter sp. 15J16-1T3B]